MNKANQNKEIEENNIKFNKEENYSNPNYYNYNDKRENYPPHPKEIPSSNNYYVNPQDYYNNQKIPIQYNNYINENENQFLREKDNNEQEKKYPSYQEQIERIKKEGQYIGNDKFNQQNKESQYRNENYNNNKNAKEIISQFNENRKKNISSEGHIFNTNIPLSASHKYNVDEQLTSKERREIQRDYEKYVDWKINEKKSKDIQTPFNQKYNPYSDNNLNRINYNEGKAFYQET